jgi:hypothetical protein
MNMCEVHPWVKTPDNANATLWRYFKSDRFVDFVETGRLHLARLDQFPDAFEGVLPETTEPLSKDHFRQVPINPGDKLTDWESYILWMNRAGRRMHFASCWYTSEYESDPMWRLYGSESIAVRSTFARLSESLTDPEPIYVGSVRYIDFRRDQPPTYGNTLVVPFLKQREYEQERELRVVVVRMPDDGVNEMLYAPDCPDSQPTGVKLDVDLSILIEKVIVAPGTPDAVRGETQERLRNIGLEMPVRPSVLDQRPSLA